MGRLNDKNTLNVLPSTLAEAAFSSLCEYWPFKQALSSNMFSDVYRSYKINYIHTLTCIHQQPQLTYNMANRGFSFGCVFWYCEKKLCSLTSCRSLGHANKMFRFPSPRLLSRWVGRSGKKKQQQKKEWKLFVPVYFCILNLTFNLQDI